ncbi:MAG: PaaI family thioesterase [Ruminococcus sp.]
MIDYEEFRSRLEGKDKEEKEKAFREMAEKNLSWRVSRAGSIVHMLAPELVSSSYERKELVMRYELKDWELNPLGSLHGGVTATMFDNQGGLLVQISSLCKKTPTVYLNVNYTAPLMPGENLIIRARVTHLGKRMINVTEEALAESDGRIIATAMVGYMAIDHVDKKC